MTGPPSSERLFTARFFVMCGFTFTVFLSLFMLLPTMPYHMLGLGGSEFAAGAFLGLLTYASALSAPFTGALADRLGLRRTLIVSGLSIAVCSVAYAVIDRPGWLLGVVIVHGLAWSGLLSASAAYTTWLIPSARRAEGISYWGLSTIAAIAVAPPVGFWLYERSWLVTCVVVGLLNVTMTGIAVALDPAPRHHTEGTRWLSLDVVEWRVLSVSLTLFLYSFGYGGITSFVALYSDQLGVEPRSLYFTVLGVAIGATRLLLARVVDRVGPRRVFIPCLVLITMGQVQLALAHSLTTLVASAILFGVGFGLAYPAFATFVMEHVEERRRASAFGSILAAFDTGIGSGSMLIGWLIGRLGFEVAFGVAAALAAVSLPYFLFVEKRAFAHRAD